MRLHLAGAEDTRFTLMPLAGSSAADATSKPNLLCSYYYNRLSMGEKERMRWRNLYDKTDANWIMDSGLFTLMFGAGAGQKYSFDELKRYTVKYIEYLREMNYRHVMVEMDVHKVLGLDALAELRKYIADNWPIEKTIYVWHVEEDIDGLLELANKYPYIAFSVPELRIIAKNRKQKLDVLLNNLMARVRRDASKYPKIHLLGCTQPGLMYNSNYYSTDSTSWQSNLRFGRFQMFDGKKFVAYDKDSEVMQKTYQRQESFIRTYIDIAKKQIGQPNLETKPYDIRGAMSACQHKRFEMTVNNQYYGGAK